MSQRGITKVAPGRYEVDFGKLRKKELRRVLAVGRQEPTEVDPYAVAQAVRTVMRDCDVRSAHGIPVLWNEYRIFLAERDYRILTPLDRRLKAELDTVIRTTLKQLNAETVGDVLVHTLVPEDTGPQAGFGVVVASFLDTAKASPGDLGEPTIRVVKRPGPREEATARVPEPAVDGALVLEWDRGKAYIPPFDKVRVGRSHGGNPDKFIELTGATNRINGYQLTIENARDGAVITRPAQANPVQVGNRLVQSGGKISVERLPVKISLSNGEMVLDLNRVNV